MQPRPKIAKGVGNKANGPCIKFQILGRRGWQWAKDVKSIGGKSRRYLTVSAHQKPQLSSRFAIHQMQHPRILFSINQPCHPDHWTKPSMPMAIAATTNLCVAPKSQRNYSRPSMNQIYWGTTVAMSQKSFSSVGTMYPQQSCFEKTIASRSLSRLARAKTSRKNFTDATCPSARFHKICKRGKACLPDSFSKTKNTSIVFDLVLPGETLLFPPKCPWNRNRRVQAKAETIPKRNLRNPPHTVIGRTKIAILLILCTLELPLWVTR